MLLFPVDALGAPVTSAGQMHNLFGTLTFFLFPVAALVLFRPLRRRGSRGSTGCCGAGDRDGRSSGRECCRSLRLSPTRLPDSVCGLAAPRRSGSTP